ncbi:MAG: hypothetical protein U0174_27200 [Polyangiaceae bacterium]
MNLSKKKRSFLGYVSMMLGVSLLCGAAYAGSEAGMAESSIKTAAVAGSAVSGFVLTFGVGRRFLTTQPGANAEPGSKS